MSSAAAGHIVSATPFDAVPPAQPQQSVFNRPPPVFSFATFAAPSAFLGSPAPVAGPSAMTRPPPATPTRFPAFRTRPIAAMTHGAAAPSANAPSAPPTISPAALTPLAPSPLPLVGLPSPLLSTTPRILPQWSWRTTAANLNSTRRQSRAQPARRANPPRCRPAPDIRRQRRS
ncbi:hypothetical protein NCC49_006084 [Naganishia albida]|nr:hypothetical protein NCC49_006084 [Naganishia albida]